MLRRICSGDAAGVCWPVFVVGAIVNDWMRARSRRWWAARRCSGPLQAFSPVASRPSSAVQHQAHEFPLRLYAMQPAQIELTEAEHVLDPAVGRLGDPFAPPVAEPKKKPLRAHDLQGLL